MLNSTHDKEQKQKKWRQRRNRIDKKVVNNKKDYLKCTSKPSYMLHKKLYLAVIRKSKVS